MSIKDLFDKPDRILNESEAEITKEIESKDYIEEKVAEDKTFIPDIDFSDPKNFARFGLAEEYYKQTIGFIQSTYPYDGSEKETLQWKKNLTYLEKYFLENEYPKSTGYLYLNADSYTVGTVTQLTSSDQSIKILSSSIGQHVKVFSGPNAYGDEYKGGNIYNVPQTRSANLDISPVDGNTVEFWFKLKSGISNDYLSASYGVFDNWNLETDHNASTYSRFLIDFNFVSSSFNVTYKVGSQGVQRQQIQVSSADFYNWHHYAFVVKNDSSAIKIDFFKDGEYVSTNLVGTAITNTVYNKSLLGHIGAYCFSPIEGDTNFTNVRNYGQLPAYIDEFRYWKTARSQKDIYRYRADRVYGGTNTDLFNTDLGLYYRFNEGIVGNDLINAVDANVLDYSGRVSNGTIVNYRLSTRQTGSAANETGLFDHQEPADPILYVQNTAVSEFTSRMLLSGSTWDEQNTTSIFRSLPEWITEEDETVGTGELKALTQIISSYFDKLYLEINYIPKFTFAEYTLDERKPAPFMNTILESNGLPVSDLFLHSKILEDLKDRDEDRLYEEKLFDLKNLIYKNIYNNLTYIFKSKGTEKGFRNLIRSFGVDDELVKINLYANNTTFTLDNNKRNTVVRKKVINLSTPDTYGSSIFNSEDSDGSSFGLSYVPPTLGGSTSVLPFYLVPLTFETEIYFPNKPDTDRSYYSVPLEKSISLFGGYTVLNTASLDYTVDSGSNKFGFEVTLEKQHEDDRGGYFKFKSLLTNESITSSYYSELYDGEKWNFAVRVATPFGNIDPIANNVAALAALPTTGSYRFELYGVNTVEDNIKNEFEITSSAFNLNQISGSHLYGKRFYVGAKRTDFSGSLVNYTDILVSNAKFWFDYVTNEEVKQHSGDSLNYGRNKLLQKPYDTLDIDINRSDLLAFSWDFDEVTGSNSSSEAYIKDNKGTKNNGSIFASNVNKRYPAKFFGQVANNTDIVKKQYTLFSRQQLPDNLFSSNTINVFGESDYYFTRDSRPINFLWSFEKSMYQTISEDILNMFAGILEFNNLIGEPLQQFRVVNRDLNHLKSIFFSKLSNTPSLEKFVEYYKWIDESLGFMLGQMIPAGVDSSNGVRNMVENHALEASSITFSPTTLRKKQADYIQIKGIKELKYNWQKGHAPEDLSAINTEQAQSGSSVWLKQRAERASAFFVNDSSQTADKKQKILDNINNLTNKKSYKLFDNKTSTLYTRTPFVDKALARVIDIEGKNVKVRSDTIDIYDVKNIENSSSTREIRPLFSGSESARVSDYNKVKPNFSKDYQYLMLGSRNTNNKYFVDITGSEYAYASSTTVSGVVDRQLPTRRAYKNIIVDKFSPIGGADISGRGAVDAASETLSPYSTINYRNSLQRKYFNAWMAQTSSISSSAPSLHKVNKNHLRLGSKDSYDNKFITRQIPRSDYNYRFLADGLINTVTSSGQYFSIYPNISISGSEFLSASIEDGVIYDFVGLNNNFTLLVDLDDSKTYSNDSLHTFLIKENGPFGYSNLHINRKQFNPLVKYYRKNNIFASIMNFKELSETIFTAKGRRLNTYVNRIKALSLVREPSIEWNLPVSEKLNVLSYSTEKQNEVNSLQVRADYSNEIDYFANDLFSQRIGLSPKADTDTGYRKLFNLYGLANDTIQDVSLGFISHKEILFPKKQFIGLNEIRTRPNYAEIAGTGSNGYDKNIASIRTFWRDRIEDRLRTNAVSSSTGTGSINSLNYANVSSSIENTYMYSFAFLQLTESNNFKSSIGIKNFNPYNSADSVFALDNTSNFGELSYSRIPGDYIAAGVYNQNNHYKGELAPYNEYEIRNLISVPSGTYSNFVQKTNFRTLSRYQKFAYSTSSLRTFPRPQFLFINHKNWYVERKASDAVIPYDSYTGVASINEGMKYWTDYLSGKKPWFDSYQEYANDIRSIGQNYSIVPEYKISNDIEYYYIQANGNFLKPKISYLSLDGVTNFDDTNNKIINDFKLNNYYNSDTLKTNIYNENKNLITNSNNSFLNIKIKGIKKLLPYKGFYPQDRSIQVVKQFSDSFLSTTTEFLNSSASVVGAYTGSVGCPIDQQILALIQPLFSPGILYNTIKASIAVDWPTFITQSTTNSYLNMPDFYGTGSSIALSASNLSYTIDKDFNYRFPFESILDINSAIPEAFKVENVENALTHNIIYYLNPTFYSSDIFTNTYYNSLAGQRISLSQSTPCFPFYQTSYFFSDLNKTWQEKNDLYRLSINNYLSEIVDFFLNNRSLTTINSKKQSDITTKVSPQKTYYMDICLYRGKNQKQLLDNSYIYNGPGFSFFGPSYTEFTRESSYYGPPSRFWGASRANLSGFVSYTDSNNFRMEYNYYYDSTADQYETVGPLFKTKDPAYAPYTPPYYYGKARARIAYKPLYVQSLNIKDVIENSVIQYINEDAVEVFKDAERTSQFSINAFLSGTTVQNYSSSPAYKNMMTLSSSLNIKQLKFVGKSTFDANTGEPVTIDSSNDSNDTLWSIQTKFETPLLNFNTPLNNSVQTIFESTNGDIDLNRFSTIGLWSGYGSIPSGNDEGIYLSIEESYGTETATTGSLRKLLGFDAVRPQQVGRIAPSKTISEAVIIIPYTKTENTNIENGLALTSNRIPYENDTERYFYVDPNILQQAITNKDNTALLRTYNLIDKYVIPPHLDWKTNQKVPPFVMFIAEFNHELDSEDLSDIWQGLLPKIGTTAEKDEVSLAIDLKNTKEFFHGKNLPADVQFKVFKVKRKAKINYYDLTSNSGDDAKFKFKFAAQEYNNVNYSFNWPYDYFSLVDRIQIEAGFSAGTQAAVAPVVAIATPSTLVQPTAPVAAPQTTQTAFNASVIIPTLQVVGTTSPTAQQQPATTQQTTVAPGLGGGAIGGTRPNNVTE
jgi:hypothetical protein